MHVIAKNNRRIEIKPIMGAYGAFFTDTGKRVYPNRLPLRLDRTDAIRNLLDFAKEKGWQVW